VVKDTNKPVKTTHTNGNTESVTHSLKKKDKEESKKKSHSNIGFDGLLRILHAQEIDTNDWIIEPIDKDKGGMNFVLPNTQGEIYLTWLDMYQVDVTFVHTKKNYNELVTLATLEVLLATMEEQRQRTVAGIRDMLKEKFSGQ